MILVLSSESDFSTFEVQRWLDKSNAKYLRLNNCNDYKLKIDSEDKSYIVTENAKIYLEDITSVWFRRKELTKTLKYESNKHIFINDVNFNLLSEENAAFASLICNLDKVFWLNSPKHNQLNKYLVIKKAKSIGINTPETLISNDYEIIKSFILKNKKVICKNIRNVRMINFKGKYYTSLVNMVDVNQFNRIKRNVKLLPSLFQKYIEKKLEIRSVFINNNFYSMAMFTQKDEQTLIDFRRIYSLDNFTRRVPFNLPKGIQIKLRKLFKELKLNSGSVDLILDKNNEIYFLEINPIGQFGMTSFPCNYYLERQFAKALIKNRKINYNHKSHLK